MVALTPQEKDVVDRFQQLPPERQRYLMLVMFRTDPDRWRRYQADGEQQLRRRAAERGLDWDRLDDEQRQDFVDDLLHEDRP
jgi:phosphopantothenoylcysteine synthetase/decarboxylase